MFSLFDLGGKSMKKNKLQLGEIKVKSFATLTDDQSKRIEGGVTECRACVSGYGCSYPDYCTGCGNC
jgi:hypothetical protein